MLPTAQYLYLYPAAAHWLIVIAGWEISAADRKESSPFERGARQRGRGDYLWA
jgi:hypothetical protein